MGTKWVHAAAQLSPVLSKPAKMWMESADVVDLAPGRLMDPDLKVVCGMGER